MTKKKKENVSRKASPNKLEAAVLNYQASKYIAENSPEKAISVLKDRVEEFKDPRSYKILGASYLQVNNYKDALASLYESWVLQPQDKEILDLILLAQKNIKESESIKILLKWAEEKPDGIAKYYRLAEAFYRNSKYNKAIPYLIKCVEECYPISKNSPIFSKHLFRYRFLLANSYHSSNQFELAAKEYKTLMNDYPEKAKTIYVHYVFVLIALKRNEEAEDYLEKIEKPDPSLARIYLLFGMTHAMRGNFQRALELVEVARDLCKSEESREAWLNSGCYFCLKGIICWEDANFHEVRSYLKKSERLLNRARDSFVSVPKTLIKLSFWEEKFTRIFTSPDIQTLFEKVNELHTDIEKYKLKPPKRKTIIWLRTPHFFYCLVSPLLAKIESIIPLYYALTFDRTRKTTENISKLINLQKGIAIGNSKLLIESIEEFIKSLQRFKSLDEIRKDDEITLLEPLRHAAFLSRSLPKYTNLEQIDWVLRQSKATIEKPKDEVTPKISETEQERPKVKPVEINFYKRNVYIDSKKEEEKKKSQWRLLEYLIMKGEMVHWIEGFAIFPSWRNIKRAWRDVKPKDPNRAFGITASRVKGIIHSYWPEQKQFDLKPLSDDENYYELKSFELFKDSLNTNIFKADSICSKAKEVFKQKDYDKGINLLLDIIEKEPGEKKKKYYYPNCLSAHKLIVEYFPKTDQIRKEKLSKTVDFFREQEGILKGSINAIDFYRKYKKDSDYWNGVENVLANIRNNQIEISRYYDLVKGYFSGVPVSKQELELKEIIKSIKDIQKFHKKKDWESENKKLEMLMKRSAIKKEFERVLPYIMKSTPDIKDYEILNTIRISFMNIIHKIENTERFRNLKKFKLYLFKTLRYRVVEQIIEDRYGIDTSMQRRIREKRRVEKRLKQNFKKELINDEIIREKLKWKKSDYDDVKMAEEKLGQQISTDEFGDFYEKERSR